MKDSVKVYITCSKQSGCSCVHYSMRLLTLWLQIAVYNACMKVAWGLSWAGSRSTKPYVFPCKVAATGDGCFLVCAAGAAALEPVRNRFLHCVLQRVVVHVGVVLCDS